MKRLSLTTRLSLLFMLAVTAVLLLAGLMFQQFSQHHFLQQDRQTLEEKRQATQRILAEFKGVEQFDQFKPQLRALLGAHRDITAIILDGAGNVLFAEPGPVELPERLRGMDDGEIWQWQEHGHLFRGLTARAGADVAGQGQPLTLMLVLDVTAHTHFFAAITRWFWIGLVLSALLSGGLGWLVARSGLEPLRQVTRVAASISATSLKERIPLTSVPHELQQLVVSFNAMLARLDDAFMRLSNFSADIAHELRTPLSNLLTQTEVVLSRPRHSEDYQETLYTNLDDLKHMSRMIDDMLFLAKADNGLIMPERQLVALEAVVGKLFEYYRLLADERGIQLRLHGQGSVRGDLLMLHRAIANLLSNALRYTPQGQTITVSIRQNESGTQLSVANPGPVIPAEHLEQLFERFYRGDPARREGSSINAGLGLAITRSIVIAHQGEIHCTSADGVTTFSLVFAASRLSG
ncbi:heavy metal sensor histidine kinase [Pseudomonas sp. N040]|uniref:heavy metal sensor histidine kinase n=1 Tax=Pseudomonas sp. N040 TaxID=2785325 RepID=UPI0018A2E9EB|nr:heavy metal sensor histidine kinase [Pseudomonas sp. N040]MBF7731700.1 heavy metal sensor histidine kinase [Pseudomonas sp. N040]MBW7015344.1 heavy metal sensor histidine kinase [Pseudomonas sp. N040]